MKTIGSVIGVLLLVTAAGPWASAAGSGNDVWKAGAASVVITPAQPTWMAGYGGRNKPSEGKFQDLFAKALVIEDFQGGRLMIVTLDLVTVPRPLRDYVAKHLNDLASARLGYCHARAGFAMNRRLPSETGFRNSPNPEGPVDHDVPVLRVEGPDGKLRAILFGYACHNTTLGLCKFCGDYAGYAQEYLEADHPGAVALFMIGCGADQNPYPRGKLEQAQQHGRALANAVEAALMPKARPVHGPLWVAMEDLPVGFVDVPSPDQLRQQAQSKDRYQKRRAELMLEELREKGRLWSAHLVVEGVEAIRRLSLGLPA
jgi:hypothetical protein